MPQLEWEKLLSTKRERETTHKTEGDYVVRNEFEADYDRIVGSSSIRRLQDKAQVFPLQQNDVARSRLTHSIEVSALARSLGKSVGRALEERHDFTPEQTDQFAAILQVAGLIHDLGNPPFGHYGETVIRNWFTKAFRETPLLETPHLVLSEQAQNDFRYFDGNVQNLRIVSRLQVQNDTYGANFTYATLGTIIKYPWPSDNRWNDKKKFGYFKSEEDLAKDIRETLGLPENTRHPATYLLEAADDIIYLCDDIEDGAKKGYINWNDEYKKIKDALPLYRDEELKQLFDDIDYINETCIDQRMEPQEQITACVRNFRNSVQGFLFKHAVKAFLDNYGAIMSGGPHPELELLGGDKDLTDQLRRVTRENCFNCREVLSLELVGDRAISTLLDIFVPAVLTNTGKDLMDVKKYPGKLFKRISPNFVYRVLNSHMTPEEIAEELPERRKNLDQFMANQINGLTAYDRLHLVTDFISGMTDSYAVNLYQVLTGMRYP